MRTVNLATVSYMGIVRNVEDRENGSILAPINEIELNKILDAQKPILAKYKYANVTQKSFSTFRNYVCESVLGMSNGGYQQLQAIWNKDKAAEIANAKVITDNVGYIDSLPHSIWCLAGDEGLLFSTSPDATYESHDDTVADDDLFFKLSEDQEFAILSAFKGLEFVITYPYEGKYGLPDLLIDDTLQKISDLFGITMYDHAHITGQDSASDGDGEIIFNLIKK